MAIQSQTVAQYGGFGNDTPKSLSEYYFSKGMRPQGSSILVGAYTSSFFTSSDYADIGNITKFARGKGRGAYGSVEGKDVQADVLFMGDAGANNVFQSYLGIFTPEHIYRVMGQNWFGAGMTTDQSATPRLLYSGWQYLGMFDPATANYSTGTIQVTNGSAAVVGTGTTFVSGDVGKVLKVDGDTGTTSFYRISAFTDATHITLASNYVGTGGSGKGYQIFRAWSDTWKDWGSSISSIETPNEKYEDVVLFGRHNNIVTLNVTTDTITTDSVPAFNMPAGYYNMAIKANTNGILMGFNSQGRGTLVLWDNYSDRSIAPWIPLDDLIIGVERYSSGWIVQTTRNFFYTNGYSIEPFITDFFEGSFQSFSYSAQNTYEIISQNGFKVIGDYLHFGDGGNTTRRRGGHYRLNLKTKLLEQIPFLTDTPYSGTYNAAYYSPDFGRIYTSASGGVGYLSLTGYSSTQTYYYISNDVGVGENPKIAEQIRLPIQISRFDSFKKTLSFTIECRVNNLDRQLHNYSQVKTTGTTTTVIVDETTWGSPQVGDLIEFISGNNKSQVRGITAITGAGTNTATYTLDSALPNVSDTNALFMWSGFKPVEKKTVTATSELFDLYFGIKNKYRGKHFKVMFIITNLNVSLELLPFEFQYDDMGILE